MDIRHSHSNDEEEEDKKELTPTNFKQLLNDIEDIEEEKFSAENITKAIESIRNLAEFLVYGSQNQHSYFELFIERNIFGILSRILEKD